MVIPAYFSGNVCMQEFKAPGSRRTYETLILQTGRTAISQTTAIFASRGRSARPDPCRKANLTIHLSVYLSIRLSVHPSIHPSIIATSVSVISLSRSLPLPLSMYIYIYICIHIYRDLYIMHKSYYVYTVYNLMYMFSLSLYIYIYIYM